MKIYNVYEAYINPVGGTESVGSGVHEIEAESAEEAARLYAEILAECDECADSVAVVCVNDDGDSAVCAVADLTD